LEPPVPVVICAKKLNNSRLSSVRLIAVIFETNCKTGFMNTRYAFACCFILLASFATARPVTGVVLHKDSRIDVLLKKQADINKVAVVKTSSGKYKGYRVMALNTNDRELAYKTKAQLLSRFPEYSVYMSYQTPFFKLKIGDFLKKEDAEDLRKHLSMMIKQGIYIVPDVVMLKPDDVERLMNEENK
jgi:hypothetical protein